MRILNNSRYLFLVLVLMVYSNMGCRKEQENNLMVSEASRGNLPAVLPARSTARSDVGRRPALQAGPQGEMAKKDELKWACPDLRYRLPITVNAGLYPHKDISVKCKLNFEKLLAEQGVAGQNIDEASLRLKETGEGKLSEETPVRYKRDDTGTGDGALGWRITGAMEPMETKTFYLYFDCGSKQSVSSSKLPAMSDELVSNPVRNSSFEEVDPGNPDQPRDWKLQLRGGGQGTMRVVEGEAHSGRRCLKIQCQSGIGYNKNVAAIQEKVPLCPKRLYEASAWFKPEDQIEPGMEFLVTYWIYRADSQNALGKIQREMFFDDGWQQIVIRGLANAASEHDKLTPEETAYCSVSLSLYRRDQKPITNCAVYVDDVELKEITSDILMPVELTVGKIETRQK